MDKYGYPKLYKDRPSKYRHKSLKSKPNKGVSEFCHTARVCLVQISRKPDWRERSAKSRI